MSSHLPIPTLDRTTSIAQHRSPHTPAAAPKPATNTSITASITLAMLRVVAPGVARWYSPRRQLIHKELRKLLSRSRAPSAPTPKPAPRQLRFHSFN